MERGNRLGRCLGKEARTCRWGKGREEVGITCQGSWLRTGGAVHSPPTAFILGRLMSSVEVWYLRMRRYSGDAG